MKLMNTQSLRLARLAETHLLAGHLHRAAEGAGRAVALARDLKERGHEAHAHRVAAEVAGARGDAPAAEDAFGQAVALATELGMVPLLVSCHGGLAQLLHRLGETDRAGEQPALERGLAASLQAAGVGAGTDEDVSGN